MKLIKKLFLSRTDYCLKQLNDEVIAALVYRFAEKVALKSANTRNLRLGASVLSIRSDF